MTTQRIGGKDLTAQHLGRTITAAWPDRGNHTHSITGEIESVTQHRGSTTSVELRVGPLRITVESGGVLQFHLHEG